MPRYGAGANRVQTEQLAPETVAFKHLAPDVRSLLAAGSEARLPMMMTMIAGEVLPAWTAVRHASGQAWRCTTDLAHFGTLVGVSIQAALPDDTLSVVIFGIVSDSSLQPFAVGTGLYLSPTGALSSAVVQHGTLQRVGQIIATGQCWICPAAPIWRPA